MLSHNFMARLHAMQTRSTDENSLSVDFEPIFARSAINTNRKSTIRAFQWAYVAPKPPKGGPKTQHGRLPSKIALRLKFLCVKTLSDIYKALA